jgi:hypothetical protein
LEILYAALLNQPEDTSASRCFFYFRDPYFASKVKTPLPGTALLCQE